MELNEKNIEEQILLYVDGELNKQEESILFTYLKQHQEAMDLLEEYKRTNIPVETIVYPEIDDLLRKEQKTIRLMSWKKPELGIAAALLLLLGLSVAFQWSRTNSEPNQPAVFSELAMQKRNATLPDKEKKPSKVVPQSSEEENLLSKQQIIKRSAEQHFIDKKNKERGFQEVEAIAFLPIVKPREQLITPIFVKVTPKANVKTDNKMLAKKVVEKDVLNKLIAVSEKSEKLQGVNDLLNQVQDKRRNIQTGWENLKHTKFTLQLGNQEIVFNQPKRK